MIGPRRPESIRWFERLTLVPIAAGLVYAWLSWDEVLALTEADGFGPELTVALVAASYGLYLLMLWLVAWRRSNVAKWIWILLCALALLLTLIDYRAVLAEDRIRVALTAIQFGLPVLALLLLFRRDSREWFAGRVEVDPEIFR